MYQLINGLAKFLPEVEPPKEKRLSFNEKLKWTAIVLVIYFTFSMINLFGLSKNALSRFSSLEVLLGAKFGSILTLGISPIVTASIILQLLNGTGIIKFELTSKEGRAAFQSTQKVLALILIVLESLMYVFMGGLSPASGIIGTQRLALQLLLVFQLMLGGILILMLDDVVAKWGFGSGISLFIAASVSKTIFVRIFSWITLQGANYPVGYLWQLIYGLRDGQLQTTLIAFTAIATTILVFLMAVFLQAMKVEIPLSFGRVRGYSLKWPLQFIYTSNIPVILVAALMANLQLLARLLQNWVGHPTFLGGFDKSGIPHGFIAFLRSPNLINQIINQGSFNIGLDPYVHALVYLLFMMGGAVLFSIFWVKTSGMDAKSQANQILKSGLQIPGFRRDPRIIESLLNRYIMPLTVMGALSVGFLAGFADLFNAAGGGTGILLTVMIVYKLYEDITKQHVYDMNPMLKGMLKKK